jgi:CDP-archaeol synthase
MLVQPVLLLKLLILLALANAVPVIAKRAFGARLARPVDGGLLFLDGRPLLGPSKTIRGIVLSLLATGIGAFSLGLGVEVGLMVAAAAMAGDLLSSFIKRRFALASSSKATGLDQVPESLLPLWACRDSLSLSLADIAVGVALFFVGEVILSRIFYRLHLRDQPY